MGHLIHFELFSYSLSFTERNNFFRLWQTDLKRLLRNPPLVKMPKASDVLRSHPLLGALPCEISEPIAGSTKETIKIRGVTLCKEGSKPNGIWLISVGVVKVISYSLFCAF